jgi:hypothetical protein
MKVNPAKRIDKTFRFHGGRQFMMENLNLSTKSMADNNAGNVFRAIDNLTIPPSDEIST